MRLPNENALMFVWSGKSKQKSTSQDPSRWPPFHLSHAIMTDLAVIDQPSSLKAASSKPVEIDRSFKWIQPARLSISSQRSNPSVSLDWIFISIFIVARGNPSKDVSPFELKLSGSILTRCLLWEDHVKRRYEVGISTTTVIRVSFRAWLQYKRHSPAIDPFEPSLRSI